VTSTHWLDRDEMTMMVGGEETERVGHFFLLFVSTYTELFLVSPIGFSRG
jgi:hypothetical protein